MPAKIKGLGRLQAKLRKIPAAAESGSDSGLGETARLISQSAKRRAPKVTGELADSITEERRAPAEWLVGTNLWRAHFTEFGTQHHGAKPFLFPAFEEHRRRAMRQIIRHRIRTQILAAIR